MDGHLKTVIMGIVALVVILVAFCAKKFCSKNFWMNVSGEFEEGVHRVEVGRRLHVHGGRVLYLPEVVTLIDRIQRNPTKSGTTNGAVGGGTERTPLLEPLIQKQEETSKTI